MTRPLHSFTNMMIPVDLIDVLNPRERNQKVFEEILKNIQSIGLKKPITVTPRKRPDGSERYLLICGEGRLKAFKALGQSHIAALVASQNEDNTDAAFIMSLSENIAKLKRRPIETLTSIQQLQDKGYNPKEISEKTGLTQSYIQGILTLLQQGEERLLVAVETGKVPLNAALSIIGSGDDDRAIQTALQDAYESGKLRGRSLQVARRLIETRKTHGRSLGRTSSKKTIKISTSSLVRNYQREVGRQKLMVKKAGYVQQRLMFVVGALRRLYADENFGNLLRAERLDTLPAYLAERVWSNGSMT